MRRYALDNEDKCHYEIVKYRFRDREWRQISLINRFALNERLLTFFIANIIMKFILEIKYFLTMIIREFIAYNHLIMT